jgi:large subunit ribosomal protein L22
MKRFSPRARGRAGRINKRTCHITVIVAKMDDERLEIVNAARSAQATASRARRVAGSRKSAAPVAATTTDADVTETVVDETTSNVVEVVETNDVAMDAQVNEEVVSTDTDEETDK